MPPRYTYWTIIVGNLPTAFRSARREELLPTFAQLRAKHPDAVMKWFARGRLWDSPEQARDAWAARPAPGGRRRAGTSEKRGPAWRPGGAHRDPRERFKGGRRKPEAGGRKPEAGGEGRAAGGGRPVAGGRKPATGGRRPEAGSGTGSGERGWRKTRQRWSPRPPNGGREQEPHEKPATSGPSRAYREEQSEPPPSSSPPPPGPDRPPRPGEEPSPVRPVSPDVIEPRHQPERGRR